VDGQVCSSAFTNRKLERITPAVLCRFVLGNELNSTKLHPDDANLIQDFAIAFVPL